MKAWMTIVMYKLHLIFYFDDIMKVVIYISGILGGIMFTMGIIGSLAESYGSDFIMFTGVALLVALFLPLALFNRYKQENKIKEMIESSRYKADQSKVEEKENPKRKAGE